MIRPGQHRCVLFDVDGTIAETEGQAHLPAFNQAMAEAGLDWHWTSADYKRLLKTTGGFERLMRFATESGHDAEALREQLAQVHKNKNRHFAAIMAAGAVAPRAGFSELVTYLARHNISWGVVTTTSRGNWEALWTYSLAPLGLPSPEVIVCGEDVTAKKPDPEAYLLALRRLNMTASECCAIEDSRNGLLAARAADLEVAIVRSEFFADERFKEAARVVDELYFLQQDNL
jgi:beta-phosphoglucomutase-like phosphatase (HAD superfamily)